MHLPQLSLVCLFALPASVASALAATNADAQQKALYMILEAADRICVTPPIIAGQTFELKGEAKVRLDNLLKWFADAGIQGAGEFQNEAYKGVLRRDLATAIKQGNECKLSVLTTLQEKIIPKSAGELSTTPKPPPVPQHRIDEVLASLKDSNPAKRRAALQAGLTDAEPDVRSVALLEALSKLKVISGEMTPILPQGQQRTTSGFQLQIVSLDPVTTQLDTIYTAYGKHYVGVVQGTSVTLASDNCSFNLELDTSRTLRGTFSCPGQYQQDVRMPVM